LYQEIMRTYLSGITKALKGVTFIRLTGVVVYNRVLDSQLHFLVFWGCSTADIL
jgi:hypothetical protein